METDRKAIRQSIRQSMNGSQFPGGLTLTAMDRLVGWCRKASRCGLTSTPIDHPCLSLAARYPYPDVGN